jgi:hypothetical protein
MIENDIHLFNYEEVSQFKILEDIYLKLTIEGKMTNKMFKITRRLLKMLTNLFENNNIMWEKYNYNKKLELNEFFSKKYNIIEYNRIFNENNKYYI